MQEVNRKSFEHIVQYIAIAHIIILFISPFAFRYNLADFWFVVVDTLVSAIFILALFLRKERTNKLELFLDMWAATPFLLLLGASPLGLVLNVGKLIGGLRALGHLHARKDGGEAATSIKIAALFISLILYFATLIVLIEGSQNKNFSTLSGGLWWAVVTITTTGYGDVTPETPLGRVAATMLMFMGIGVSSAIGAVFVSYLLRPTEEKILKQEQQVVKEEKQSQSRDEDMLRLLKTIDKRLSRLELQQKTKRR